MKKIALIGCNSHQLPLITKAKELGYETHVFAWQTGDVGESFADFFYPISITDKQAILEKCREISPDGIVSIASDLSAITAGYVANGLGLSGNSEAAIRTATNKIRFRKCMQKNGILQPAFAEVGDIYPVEAVGKLNFPVVVKPSDRSGNRCVYRANTTRELLQSIPRSKEVSFERKAIVEEYIEGTYFSAECLSQHGNHVVIAYTKKESVPYYQQMLDYRRIQGNHFNLPAETESIVKKVLSCTGLTDGASSVEFIVSPDQKIYIIEVMPSMYGDFVGSDLVPYVYGYDYLKSVIDIACGIHVTLPDNLSPKASAESGFILCKSDYLTFRKQKEEGTVIASSRFEEAENIPDSLSGITYGYYVLRAKSERELSGRKLLILGANPETTQIVLCAKELGVTTIVTDYTPGAPAKEYADISYDIDAMNTDAIVKLASEENVNGVLVGVADPLIGTYQKVCERLNLPCYANADTVYAFTNKRHFKDVCRKYDIKGVPEYHLPEDKDLIQYPLVVKPADSNSGKGITLCYSENDLPVAIENARKFSRSDTYLIEKYMTCRDVSIYYTCKDKKAYLSSISDRYTTDSQNGVARICTGDVFPSSLMDEFIKKEHPKYCRMFHDLKLENGVFYVSAFYENGTFYVYDPGFRLQGGGFHFIVAGANGFDQREMLIRYALTGTMGHENLDTLNDPDMNGQAACVLWFLLKEGTIAKILGDDFIKSHPNVIRIIERFKEGDVISPNMIGTEQQVYMRIFIVCDNKPQLKQIIRDMEQTLKIYDVDGNSMLLPSINTEII